MGIEHLYPLDIWSGCTGGPSHVVVRSSGRFPAPLSVGPAEFRVPAGHGTVRGRTLLSRDGNTERRVQANQYVFPRGACLREFLILFFIQEYKQYIRINLNFTAQKNFHSGLYKKSPQILINNK